MKFHVKKWLASGLATGMLFSLASSFSGTFVSADSTLTANEITENMSIGWNIGNSLDATGSGGAASQETSWGNPKVTQELIDTVKEKGFNTVRIPTTWYPNVTTTTDEDGNPVYTISTEWLERVQEVVDYCYNDDMYVILNLHHESWINRSDFSTAYEQMSEQLIQMWQQIAEYFKDYDQHLIFEGMNEPRQTNSDIEWTGNEACYEVVNKLDADFVETVRSVDSPYQETRLLMIPAYAASGYASAYSYLDVPEDDYVAVSLHAYTPYDFAMGDGDHTTFSNKNKSDLDTIFSDIQYYFTDRDIPVVLGEFSASNFNNTDARCDWATYYITWAKELGIPCVLWDNNAYTNNDASEAHGYLNRSNNTWYEQSEPVVDAMMAVIADDSVEWGSQRHLPTWKHSDLSEGIVLYENEEGLSLIAADPDGKNCTPGIDISSETLNENREIAIRYSGSVAPILALTDDSWGNWTEFSAYAIDEENGIAYYSADTMQNGWGDLSTAAHLFARAGTDMTIYQVVSLPAAELVENSDGNTETITVTLLGDVTLDDTVSVSDLVALQKYLLGNDSLSQQAFVNADMNGDQHVNGLDLSAIRQKLL
jgi:aryl-phospho-beta-D-glucosidase BglC (GH1 family)